MDWEGLSEEQVAVLVASILGDGEITKCYPYDRRVNNNYTIRVSIPARPYSDEEIALLIKWKQQRVTNKEIARRLNRTYWSVVYKWQDVKNREA